jgi:hypothetical protein
MSRLQIHSWYNSSIDGWFEQGIVCHFISKRAFPSSWHSLLVFLRCYGHFNKVRGPEYILNARITCHPRVVCEDIRVECSFSSTQGHSSSTLNDISYNDICQCNLVSDEELAKAEFLFEELEWALLTFEYSFVDLRLKCRCELLKSSSCICKEQLTLSL